MSGIVREIVRHSLLRHPTVRKNDALRRQNCRAYDFSGRGAEASSSDTTRTLFTNDLLSATNGSIAVELLIVTSVRFRKARSSQSTSDRRFFVSGMKTRPTYTQPSVSTRTVAHRARA